MNTAVTDPLSWMKQQNPYDIKLTSAQMFGLLDDLIARALKPIFESTLIADEVIAQCITWQMSNKRRKLSAFKRGDLISLMTGFLSIRNPAHKLDMFFQMQMERTVPHAIIETFLERTEHYESLVLQLATCSKGEYNGLASRKGMIESSVRYTFNRDLWSARRQVLQWYSLANELRDAITRKYTRYLFSKVRSEVSMATVKVDMLDMAQNFLLATIRAINKYNAAKGTFTSYLDYWVKDAKTSNEFNHYMGLAYYLPSVDLAESEGVTNLYTSLEDQEVEQVSVGSYEDTIIEQSVNDRVYALAEYADPIGYARAAFNLD